MKTVADLIDLATKYLRHGPMATSAELCASDAIRAYKEGDEARAIRWAIRSLDYSIGILHEDHPRNTRWGIPSN